MFSTARQDISILFSESRMGHQRRQTSDLSIFAALQRLASAWAGEPAWTDILFQEHTPFHWRVAMALVHGLTVGAAFGLGFSEERAGRALTWAVLLVPLVVLPLALAMVAVP